MRTLFIGDSGGDGMLDAALRAQALGHDVRFFAAKYDATTRPVGKGLVKLMPEWRSSLPWADLVICEGNGKYLHELEAWRRRGVPVIGGSPQSAALELDREIGMQAFEEAGIAIAPYEIFTDYPAAIAYVEDRGEVMYSKPCSDTSDKSLSAKTGIDEDPSYQLRAWQKKHGRPPSRFLLQDRIDGVEFGVAAWFGPQGFEEGVEEHWEHKRFCAGDVGPNTGEMGTVCRLVRQSKLFRNVLEPLEERLAALAYVGNIAVNCLVDQRGEVWPLEFTTRLGWPAFNIELALFDGDFVEFLLCLALGEDTSGFRRLEEVAVGVVLAVPPYPHPPRSYDDIVGLPIYARDFHAFHPCEVMCGDDSPLATAGHYVGVATGTGASVSEAARHAYQAIRKVHLPGNPFWRVDIGQRLKKDIPRLQEHGFATDMVY